MAFVTTVNLHNAGYITVFHPHRMMLLLKCHLELFPGPGIPWVQLRHGSNLNICLTTLHWIFWHAFNFRPGCVVLKDMHFHLQVTVLHHENSGLNGSRSGIAVYVTVSPYRNFSDWWTLNSNKSFNCKTKTAGFSNTLTSLLSSKWIYIRVKTCLTTIVTKDNVFSTLSPLFILWIY